MRRKERRRDPNLIRNHLGASASESQAITLGRIRAKAARATRPLEVTLAV